MGLCPSCPFQQSQANGEEVALPPSPPLAPLFRETSTAALFPLPLPSPSLAPPKISIEVVPPPTVASVPRNLHVDIPEVATPPFLVVEEITSPTSWEGDDAVRVDSDNEQLP